MLCEWDMRFAVDQTGGNNSVKFGYFKMPFVPKLFVQRSEVVTAGLIPSAPWVYRQFLGLQTRDLRQLWSEEGARVLPLFVNHTFLVNNPGDELFALVHLHDSPRQIVVLVYKVYLLIQALLRSNPIELGSRQLPVHLGRVAVHFVGALDKAVHVLRVTIFAAIFHLVRDEWKNLR